MNAFITTFENIIKLKDRRMDNTKASLQIPLYQREYKWNSEMVNTLLTDVNSGEKFLGLIILDEKEDCYEIVDGQQRLTTCLLVLVSLFNSLIDSPIEQKNIKSYIVRENGQISINNKSVDDYLWVRDDTITLQIQDDKDVYYQKEKFAEVLELTDLFVQGFQDFDQKNQFLMKLSQSKMLVLINDSTEGKPIEQIFLDINEKALKLDVENIFKGHCFEKCREGYYEILKEKWVKLKKNAFGFQRSLYYKDLSSFLYLYLLKNEALPENLSPQGKHYLTGKNIDQIMALLDSMINFGDTILKFVQDIQSDRYFFEDFSSDCERNKTQIDAFRVMKKMSKEILEVKGAEYQKFPFMHFVANKNKYKDKLTFDQLKRVICNLYIYSTLFVIKNAAKDKSRIDRTVILEVEKNDVDIHSTLEAVKSIRKKEAEGFLLQDTNNKDIIYFITTIIDYFDRQACFINEYYSLDRHYNLEHFVVPDGSRKGIEWVVEWEKGRNGQPKPKKINIYLDDELAKKYKKKIGNYLIIDDELNGDMHKYDIIEKIELIQNWHTSRSKELPKHIDIIIAHISSLPAYKTLSTYKTTKEEDVEKIQRAYVEFVNQYFSENEICKTIQDAFLEKIQ